MEGVSPHGRMFQLKTNPLRLTGVNGTVCHCVTVFSAGGGNRMPEMRSVGSLLYPPISERTSSTNYTPWRLQGTLVSTRRIERVKDRFYWPGCTKDVKDWCRACDLCASRERPTRTPRAPLRTYNVGAPLERVALDIWDRFPTRTVVTNTSSS